MDQVRIFKEGLGLELPDDEPVKCDSGPGGDPWLMPQSAGINSYAHPENEVMVWKHQLCFEAVVVITQLKLDVGGESLFDGGAYDVTY
eukprot:jgi/Psemu1/43107/gm1.43107_g